jgi:hypothetical protein
MEGGVCCGGGGGSGEAGGDGVANFITGWETDERKV